jgi:N utilization substance protein B
MQLLYAVDVMKPEKPLFAGGDLSKTLLQQIDQTRALVVYLLDNLVHIAGYAEKHARQLASKHIVTSADLAFNIKLAGNEVIWKIKEDTGFQNVISIEKTDSQIDPEIIKKIFLELITTATYQDYIAQQNRDKKSESAIISFIFTNLLLTHEGFLSQLEERFANLDDDAEMAEQMVMQYLHKPSSMHLDQSVAPDKWQYARQLLHTVMEKEDYLMELIKPKLKNWDSDRIALIDMVLLKMGLTELLYFETIPTKVTINEYIDIAKDYSTQQSGQFVNGILDSIHKELISQNKIQKVDFKK